MVSIDVSSLFTNVPTGEAMQAKDDSLDERTSLSPDKVADILDMQLWW